MKKMGKVKLRRNTRVFGLLLPLGFVLGSLPAWAAATQSDLVIAARALGFMENGPKGDVTVGIVYDPTSNQSVQDADGVQKILSEGLKVGNLTLKPVMVKTDEIAAAKVGLFFLTEGVGGDGMKVAVVEKTKHIPCVTVDLPQVRNGACVMGVQSQPKVEILVNRAAAADSGMTFAAVFRMMITEF
ncbi:MAG: hypothetical protein EPO08_01565 [Rhodospirillaceae bacterium]|nr:MAG: hypothetical protein EPO08_01565 [Rhodospirillaceae bacterium]